MVINPTLLAQRVRSSSSWPDAHLRVVHAYRQWIRSAPEIQSMYSLNIPVSRIRTKMRSEFERHRYVNKLEVVNALLTKNSMEFQETLNFWKQVSHVLKYFKDEESNAVKLPANFMQGFLEGRN